MPWYPLLHLWLLIVSLARVSETVSSIPCTLDYDQIPYATISLSLDTEYGRILQNLGTGSTGEVLLLRRFKDDNLVAIKKYRSLDGPQIGFHPTTIRAGKGCENSSWNIILAGSWQELVVRLRPMSCCTSYSPRLGI